jgi:hypothetical protein
MATLADMTVPFEIQRNPPPTIEGGPNGKSGTITFLVTLNDVPNFVNTLAGTPVTIDQPGGGTIERVVPLQHPDYPDMLAVAFRSEAFGTPGGSGASYVSEMYSHARVTVEFTSVPFDLAGDQPFLTIQTQMGSSHEIIPGSAFRFADMTRLSGDAAVSVDEVVFSVTTYLSQQAVGPEIRNLVGKVNSSTFLDCPPGTVRFGGVTTEFDQKVSFQKSYIKTFNFRYRSRPWNQVLRHDGVWEAPQNTATGETKYATGSLQPLLQ